MIVKNRFTDHKRQNESRKLNPLPISWNVGWPKVLYIGISLIVVLCILFTLIVSPISNPLSLFSTTFQRLISNSQHRIITDHLSTMRLSPATGPLRVNSANPRYFTDGSGKAILLTGSHTWDNRQDQSTADFDWNNYLDNLESWNHNFIRLWVWEQAKNLTTWPDPVNPETTLTPEIWLRTGPGKAADGGLKFDLNQYNQEHFNRLRQRIIEAGDRGIYVSIMLFDGWSVAQKAGGSNPWTHHPFRSTNNINGINGDPNADNAGYETQNLSDSAITALQEAYVAHVIDTVNDLDNVLYEISNESAGDVSGTLAWINHFIDYIHTYEAAKPKQHPVWFTVPYFGGNNQDLLDSEAEAISPNSDVTNDGTKVVIPDTDHYFGIGGDANWAWMKFTQGYGGVAYMDSWDNLLLDASGSGHPIQNLRDNLGYVLTYANRMNLEAMTPRGDLCSTGYCLANPVAIGAEYLIYLPPGNTTTALLENLGLHEEDHKRISSVYLPSDSSVTVDLSGTPGDLSVEWFDPSTGEVAPGGTVTGGASRHFIAPFTGAAVLYLYHSAELSISNVKAHAMDNNASINWTTNQPATSQIEYGISPSLGMNSSETSSLRTSHSVLIHGLLANTKYYYKVRSKNVDGRSVESAISNFTTLAPEEIKRYFLPYLNIGVHSHLFTAPLYRRHRQ
jgi:hypothetical protein